MNEGRPTSHKEGGEWEKHPPLRLALERHFGFHDFRPGQHEAIQQLLDGRHVLVVMPTGAGKSLIYQLVACLLPGTTLVISPLIALMKDQVDALDRRGIPATAINSTVPAGEQARRLKALTAGAYHLVYVAPERLRHRAFRQALADTRISLLAVDEAHCISQWGHDFRPDYLDIAATREEMGHPVTTGLTATATPQVQDDILRRLDLSDAERIITGFNRPNLSFQVQYTPDLPDKLRALREFLTDNAGAGIIYVGTRREAEEVADFIREVGRRQTRAYHAGLEDAHRTTIQDAFMGRQLDLVVATNAFGMGVDRADVRFVLHFSLPGTLEAYYQEAGRAGRDGAPAQCALLYAPQDRALQEWFIENDAPSPQELESLYRAVAEQAQGVAVLTDDLALATGLPEVKLRVGLSILERMEALHRLGDEGRRIWLEVGTWRPERLRVTTAELEARRAHKRRQLARMVAYAETDACRRRLVLDHFGDTGPADAPVCCDNCLSIAPARPSVSAPDRVAIEALPTEQVALAVLDTVRRLPRAIGREKLAQVLKGSRAKDILTWGYDRSPYYGRLADLTLEEIQAVIRQLIQVGCLKVVGGKLPVVQLTPRGQQALAQREAIQVHVPGRHRPEAAQRKREEREAGGTVAYTGELLTQGMTPAQIAAHRGLKESTIYDHLAQRIAAGVVDLDAVVPRDLQEQVRAAIRQAGSTQALSPIKALLPDEISYGVIRCVVADWEREQMEPQADEVMAYLSRSHPRPLPGPWKAGWALDFHSRFAGADWSRTEAGDLAHRFKYGGETALADALAERLHALVQAHPELAQVDAILPVPPSTPRAADPVQALAVALGQRLQVPVQADWLVKTRATQPQKEMRTLAQKRANVAGAFAVSGPVHGRHLLVLDDLYDSGATLEEVARVLNRSGASAVLVLTLTRTIHSDA